ncbi:MAG: hypothetical protein L3K17_04520 [Thermoplasmata archaeon]|nr:hypothetical protein [Thermoplasmata archaeon]
MDIDGCALPEDRLYDLEQDVWFRWEEGRRTATIGILGSLASFAGRFQAVTYRPIEGHVARGRSVATVESVRFTGAVRMPVDGTLVDRNGELPAHPKLLNDAPFDQGWVVRIAPTDREAPERLLATAERVEQELRAKIHALKIRCYPAAPDVELYEIGAECAAILARLDEEVARRAPGEIVLLVTDDATSPIEMVRWADRTGHAVLAHRVEDRLHHFLVRREAHPVPRRRRQ